MIAIGEHSRHLNRKPCPASGHISRIGDKSGMSRQRKKDQKRERLERARKKRLQLEARREAQTQKREERRTAGMTALQKSRWSELFYGPLTRRALAWCGLGFLISMALIFFVVLPVQLLSGRDRKSVV